MIVRGVAVERRRTKRDQILVDIDIAHPGTGYCHGHVKDISKGGVSVIISEGELPAGQRSVILNLRVWTGSGMLYRKIYCRVVRRDEGQVAMEFAENDIVTEAIVQDLIFYQKLSRKRAVQTQEHADTFSAPVPEPLSP